MRAYLSSSYGFIDVRKDKCGYKTFPYNGSYAIDHTSHHPLKLTEYIYNAYHVKIV